MTGWAGRTIHMDRTSLTTQTGRADPTT